MKKWMTLLGLIILFAAPCSFAVLVHNLNAAQIPVKNRSHHSLGAALPHALAQALVKISGNQSITTVPTVRSQLNNASRYLQSYSYTTKLRAGGSVLYLQTQFDYAALTKLLRRLGQPIWRADRPLVLAWLQVQNPQQGDFIVSADNDGQLVQQVKTAADIRGIPLLLPMMDLADQNFVTPFANTFNDTQLQALASRYQAPVIFAAKIQQTLNQQWQAQWLLVFNNAPLNWTTHAASLSDLVKQGVNKLADLLANQLAVNSSSRLQSDVILEVSNVNRLRDYVLVLKRLRQLSVVGHVQLTRMHGSRLLLQLSVTGGEEGLRDALNLSQHFKPISSALIAGSDNANLYYRWRRR